MAFPDSTWTRFGKQSSMPFSKGQIIFTMWDIYEYDEEKRKQRKGCYRELKSDDFSFAGATWNFFASFDPIKTLSQFGINVQTHSSSDEVLNFFCGFVFRSLLRKFKTIECKFKCESAGSHWAVTDFMTSSEIENFLQYGEIYCIIRVENIKEVCSQTEITLSSESNCVETHTQTQFPENAELPMPGFDYKVLQDFKNLCLNGEGSDVTLQVEDQQFKAHRSFLMARSSVFAAMFNCDMKEKATGNVNVKDCELSSFPVFLEYLYCGSTENISSENVFNLYVSADKYNVQDLKRKCLEFMEKNLSVNTFCETLQIALQHSETYLLKLTTEFFIRNVLDITLTTKWQTFLAENSIQGNELFIKAARTFR